MLALESIHDNSCPYVVFFCTCDAFNRGRSTTLSDKLQDFDISLVRISGSPVVWDQFAGSQRKGPLPGVGDGYHSPVPGSSITRLVPLP
jgi:hypothetical protein